MVGVSKKGFPGDSDGEESACKAGDLGSLPGSGRSLEEEMATPVFWPGESRGQRSLEGCSPWGHRESDTTERLSPAHDIKNKDRANTTGQQPGRGPCLTSEGITDLAFYADHLHAFLYSPNTCVCIPEQDTSILKTDFAKGC